MPESRFDPDGARLPIKLDCTTNGEFAPLPEARAVRAARDLARRWSTENARRQGLARRDFLVSACGAATGLLAANAVHAAGGRGGGFFEVDAQAAVDPDAAARQLAGREFVFDVQGHFIGEQALAPGDRRGAADFLKDVFLDSDTDMMVLSFVPSRRDAEPLTIEEADGVRRLVDELEGSQRLLLHGRVNPNQDGDLQGMDELAERHGVSAWKTYTQWGPRGEGYALTDEDTGIPFIEKARALGVKVICVHKGIPFGRRSYEHSLCDDIGAAARLYPDVDFIVYHSGWVPGLAETAYGESGRADGIDSLVRSVIEHEVAPNSNVFAELGSTWRGLMQDPESAAHALGKLFRHVGEDNVLWGTDSIWYGSPQDQIQAFRTFQIAPALREAHGYPAITPELRAKVFGLNATRPYRIEPGEVLERARTDAVGRRRLVYQERPDPHFLTFGPRTRAEFLRLRRLGGGPG